MTGDSNHAISKSLIKRLSDFLRARLPDNRRFLVLCAVVGVFSGLAAVAFHLSIDWLRFLVFEAPWLKDSRWLMIALPFIPAFGGLLVGILLVRIAPTARGSGIPQTKDAFYNKFGYFHSREGIMRFVLGVLSIGTGTSLGREGPTVHICATIASKVGQWLGLAKPRIQAMVPVGMGAGIAAAFNTPLAAITFVFEELLDDFSSKALGGILIAVIIASVVTRALLGENPAFQLEVYIFHSYSWTAISLLVGVSAGVLGHAFTGSLLHLRHHFQSSRIPMWLQPAIGGFGVGLLGTLVLYLSQGDHFGIFGIGYEDLSLALRGSLVIRVVLLLFIGKFVATLLAYSMGGCGGLFAPVLFIGGMLGALIGCLCQLIFNFDDSIVGACALLGMGAFFAAVIRCPITSLLIIFEMTLNYSLILPLMAGNMIAYYLAARWRPVPLYNALLLQDRVTLRKMPSYQGAQDWRNLPVSVIMTHDPIAAYADKTLAENLAYLREHQHHAYPVRGEDRKLVNIITHHELEELADAHGDSLLGDLLKKRRMVTMVADTSIRDAADILINANKEQAPVVSSKTPDRIVGFLTLHDIARQQNAISEQIGR